MDHEIIIRVLCHQSSSEPQVTVMRRRQLLNDLGEAGWSEPELESLDARLDLYEDLSLGPGITLHRRTLSKVGRVSKSKKQEGRK